MRIDVKSSAFGPMINECPTCRSEDVTSWAENGEDDLADWYECEACGQWGAVLSDSDPRKTQNGFDPFTVER
jgi:Zn ribbon nucleic-acid-binding protein